MDKTTKIWQPHVKQSIYTYKEKLYDMQNTRYLFIIYTFIKYFFSNKKKFVKRNVQNL